MATIINNPAERTDRVVETSTNDTTGWAVAVIVLLVVLAVGAFLWMRYYNAPAAATQNTTPGSANINVTLPSGGDTNNSGASNGDTSGASAGGATAPAAQ